MLIIFSIAFNSCKEKEDSTKWTGSGTFYQEFENKLVQVLYFVPKGSNASTPILILFHGVNRDPVDYLNEMTSTAIAKKFIVVVPNFSEENFPNESAFQMGNIFKDGDNPTAATLNKEESWSLSIVEPIFQLVKANTGSTLPKCYLIGHSAGAQFLHRMLLFKKNFPFEKAVVSAAGWYTVTDTSVRFPYGLKASPFDINHLKSVFSENITIQVGSDDNNPNASNLRQGDADKQGSNRLSRAQFFYKQGEKAALQFGVNFNWKFVIVNGLSHDSGPAIRKSAEIIFE